MPDDVLFAMFFQGLASIQFHPKNQDNTERYSLEKCAGLAFEMLQIHRTYFPKEV